MARIIDTTTPPGKELFVEHPADLGTQASAATGLLTSVPVEPRLPAQDDHDWHPERRSVDLDDESHLIRGYD